MAALTDHGYLWSDLWETPRTCLSEGDTFVVPGGGCGYTVARDGAVEGAFSYYVGGLALTIVSVNRADGTMTVTDHEHGNEYTWKYSEALVLAVLPKMAAAQWRSCRAQVRRAVRFLEGISSAERQYVVDRVRGLAIGPDADTVIRYLKWYLECPQAAVPRAMQRRVSLVTQAVMAPTLDTAVIV